MTQYRDVPMNFGDASLVVAAETLNIFTTHNLTSVKRN